MIAQLLLDLVLEIVHDSHGTGDRTFPGVFVEDRAKDLISLRL